MALREIVKIKSDTLRKKCKTVKCLTKRDKELIEDMFETMYDANGVGLAAPQIGVLKRIIVVDIYDEEIPPFAMINPEIIEYGEQIEIDYEGCLSIPGYRGEVGRPTYVKVKFNDEEMNECVMEAEGFLARALCHEIDHINGYMYIDRLVSGIETNEGEKAQLPDDYYRKLED